MDDEPVSAEVVHDIVMDKMEAETIPEGQKQKTAGSVGKSEEKGTEDIEVRLDVRVNAEDTSLATVAVAQAGAFSTEFAGGPSVNVSAQFDQGQAQGQASDGDAVGSGVIMTLECNPCERLVIELGPLERENVSAVDRERGQHLNEEKKRHIHADSLDLKVVEHVDTASRNSTGQSSSSANFAEAPSLESAETNMNTINSSSSSIIDRASPPDGQERITGIQHGLHVESGHIRNVSPSILPVSMSQHSAPLSIGNGATENLAQVPTAVEGKSVHEKHFVTTASNDPVQQTSFNASETLETIDARDNTFATSKLSESNEAASASSPSITPAAGAPSESSFSPSRNAAEIRDSDQPHVDGLKNVNAVRFALSREGKVPRNSSRSPESLQASAEERTRVSEPVSTTAPKADDTERLAKLQSSGSTVKAGANLVNVIEDNQSNPELIEKSDGIPTFLETSLDSVGKSDPKFSINDPQQDIATNDPGRGDEYITAVHADKAGLLDVISSKRLSSALSRYNDPRDAQTGDVRTSSSEVNPVLASAVAPAPSSALIGEFLGEDASNAIAPVKREQLSRDSDTSTPLADDEIPEPVKAEQADGARESPARSVANSRSTDDVLQIQSNGEVLGDKGRESERLGEVGGQRRRLDIEASSDRVQSSLPSELEIVPTIRGDEQNVRTIPSSKHTDEPVAEYFLSDVLTGEFATGGSLLVSQNESHGSTGVLRNLESEKESVRVQAAKEAPTPIPAVELTSAKGLDNVAAYDSLSLRKHVGADGAEVQEPSSGAQRADASKMEILMEVQEEEGQVEMENAVVTVEVSDDNAAVSRAMDAIIDGALYDVEMNFSGEEVAEAQVEGAEGDMEIEDNSPVEEVVGIMEIAVEGDNDVEMMYEAEEVMDAMSGEREIEMDGTADGASAVPFAEFLAQEADGIGVVAGTEVDTPLDREAADTHEMAVPQVEAFVMTDNLAEDIAIVSAVEVSIGEDNQTLSTKEVPVVLVSEEALHATSAKAGDEAHYSIESSSEDGGEGEEGSGVLVGIGSYVVNSGLTITEVAGSIETDTTTTSNGFGMETTTTFLVAIPREEIAVDGSDFSLGGVDAESGAMGDVLDDDTEGNVGSVSASTGMPGTPGVSEAPSAAGVVEPVIDNTRIRLEATGEGLVAVVDEIPNIEAKSVPSGSLGFAMSDLKAGTIGSDQAHSNEASGLKNSIDLVFGIETERQAARGQAEAGSGAGEGASGAEFSGQDEVHEGLSGMKNGREEADETEEKQDLEMKVPPSGEVSEAGVRSVEEQGVQGEKPLDDAVGISAFAVAGDGEKQSSVGNAGQSDVDKKEENETMELAADVAHERKRRRDDKEGDIEDEKASKSVMTSNAEKLTADADRPVDEGLRDVKKRSREESPTPENADAVAQLKAQKTEDDGALEGSASKLVTEADVLEDKASEENGENGALQKQRIAPVAPRFKKRKIAIFLGYSGAGYQGMQKNPGAVTIEGELEQALHKAGAISEANFGEPKKIDWKRAARTDKGVSAVGQVVSGCFFIDPPGLVERVNTHLPKQIRVYGYKRATAGFDAKRLCDRRKYEYVLPVYAFDPNIHLDRETARLRAQSVLAMEIRTGDATALKPGDFDGVTDTIVIEKETSVFVNDNANPETAAEIAADSLAEVADLLLGQDKLDSGSVMKAVETAAEVAVNGLDEVGKSEELANVLLEQDVAGTGNNVETVESKTEISSEAVPGERNSCDGLERAVDEVSRKEDPDSSNKAVERPAIADDSLQAAEGSDEEPEENGSPTEEGISPEEVKSALKEKVKTSSYKYDEAEANRLNKILKTFEGNHNFHNFTARVKSSDPSANRYILSFEAEKVFQFDGVDFVRCTVVGQSFMLHQIRKMIGLAVAIMRGVAPMSVLESALRKDMKVPVPMAPELGLFLEECYFSSYNRRFQKTHEDLSLKSYENDVSAFKKDFIYPHIASTEAKDSTFAMWLHSLNDRHFPEFAAAREKAKEAAASK